MEPHRPGLLGIITVSQVGLALALLAVALKSEILQAHEMPLYYHYIASLGNGAEPAESQSRGRSGFNASEFAIVLGNARESRRYTDTLALLSGVMLLAPLVQVVLVQRAIRAAASAVTSASRAPRAT
jgi:hypothetical protein